MNILLSSYQRGQAYDTSARLDKARDAMERLQLEVESLRQKTDSLMIACQALWELLRQKTSMSDEMILNKMQEIDLRDGQADGKITPSLRPCPVCRRNNKANRRSCLYCGAPLAVDNVFDKA